MSGVNSIIDVESWRRRGKPAVGNDGLRSYQFVDCLRASAPLRHRKVDRLRYVVIDEKISGMFVDRTLNIVYSMQVFAVGAVP